MGFLSVVTNKYFIIVIALLSLYATFKYQSIKIDKLNETVSIYEIDNAELNKTITQNKESYEKQKKQIIKQLVYINNLEKKDQENKTLLVKSLEKQQGRDIQKIFLKKKDLAEKLYNEAVARSINEFNEFNK